MVPRSPELFVTFPGSFLVPLSGGILAHSCTDPRDTVLHSLHKTLPTSFFKHRIWQLFRVACTQHQSRAHLISNEPPRGRPGQNSMPTSADTRTYDRVHRQHTAMAPPQVQGARSRLTPRAGDLRYWGRPARRPGFTSAHPAPRAAGYATLASRDPPTYRGGARQCWPVIPGPIAELDPAWTYPAKAVCATGQLGGRPAVHSALCAP